jgi:hypothetical protein
MTNNDESTVNMDEEKIEESIHVKKDILGKLEDPAKNRDVSTCIIILFLYVINIILLI